MANANAPTAEIADPSFAALVAAMQQLTLVLNANLTLMSSPSAMAALNTSAALAASAPASTPTASTSTSQESFQTPVLSAATSPTVPGLIPTPDTAVSDGIHPDDVSQLPEVLNGPAIDTWYTVIIGVTPGVYHDWVEVGPLVNGISGVVYRKLSSKAQALDMYAKAWYKGQVRRSH